MKYISRIIGLLLIVLSLLLGYAAIRLCVSSPSVPAYFVAMILIPVCAAFVIVAIEFMQCASWREIRNALHSLAEMFWYFG